MAQTPCFTMDKTSGCVPLTINVTDCSGHPTSPQYSYGGSTFITGTNHTFTTPGNYNVIQAIDISGNFKFDTQTVQVLPIPAPLFELTNCGGNQVHISFPDWGYDEYDITWEAGNTQNTLNFGDFTYTYGSNADQTIRVEGIYDPELCGKDTSLSITPIPAIDQANIDTLRVLDDTSLVLHITGQNRVAYQIDMTTNGSGSVTYEIIPEGNVFRDTITGLNTTANTYCFTIRAFNRCTNATETTSDEVCSVVLSGSAQTGYNDVSWSAYAGVNFSLFDLERNGTSLATFSSAQNPYSDSSIFCSRAYAYRLVTTANNLRTSYSISNVVDIIGESAGTPQAISRLYSTFNNDNQIEVNWSPAPNIAPLFYTVGGTQVNDTTAILPEGTNCFQVTYTDSCDNTSAASDQTCPIRLSGTASAGLGDIPLEWTDYVSFASGLARYIVSAYDKDLQLITSIPAGTALNYAYTPGADNNQIFYFRITGIANDSTETYSNRIQIVLNNRIAVPNAFTPNGDGNNDIFLPKTRFVDTFQMSIYTKWGEQVFNTTNVNEGWDGGGYPPGVYSYVITIVDFEGETTTRKGTVTLMQ